MRDYLLEVRNLLKDGVPWNSHPWFETPLNLVDIISRTFLSVVDLDENSTTSHGPYTCSLLGFSDGKFSK